MQFIEIEGLEHHHGSEEFFLSHSATLYSYELIFTEGMQHIKEEAPGMEIICQMCTTASEIHGIEAFMVVQIVDRDRIVVEDGNENIVSVIAIEGAMHACNALGIDPIFTEDKLWIICDDAGAERRRYTAMLPSEY